MLVGNELRVRVTRNRRKAGANRIDRQVLPDSLALSEHENGRKAIRAGWNWQNRVGQGTRGRVRLASICLLLRRELQPSCDGPHLQWAVRTRGLGLLRRIQPAGPWFLECSQCPNHSYSAGLAGRTRPDRTRGQAHRTQRQSGRLHHDEP